MRSECDRTKAAALALCYYCYLRFLYSFSSSGVASLSSSVKYICSVNLMPKVHFLIQGASGFNGIALIVNCSSTELSTQGIILGGLMNGKEKLGFIYRQAVENWGKVNFAKEKKLHRRCCCGNTFRVAFYF